MMHYEKEDKQTTNQKGNFTIFYSKPKLLGAKILFVIIKIRTFTTYKKTVEIGRIT